MNKKFAIILAAAIVALSVSGCTKGDTASDISQNNSSSQSQTQQESALDTEKMFTDRDKEIGYDEANSTKITLSDSEGNVKITEEGTYILSGTLSNGQIVIDAAKTDKIQLVLNNVNINCDTSAAIYVKQADKVFVTLANGSENTLSNKSEFVSIDDNNIDAVIYSKDDLTINGLGKLTINANFGHGIVSKDDLAITSGTYNITSQRHALAGKDCVKIADGTFSLTSGGDGIHADNSDDSTLGYIYIQSGSFNITAETDGLDASATLMIEGGAFDIKSGGGSENASVSASGQQNQNWGKWGQQTQSNESTESSTTSAKGLKSGGDLVISGGTFAINSSDDSIHSNANVKISDGIFKISSGDDGIHADVQTAISGGNINILQSYEGIEGKNIEISGGDISLIAKDDGINSAGGSDQSAMGGRPGQNSFSADSDCYIKITGGKITINAAGDGVDSNGNLYVTGGETYVSGPTDNGNSALDYNGSAEITGGIFIAAGSSGMAQNFGNNSTQGAMLVTLQSMQQAGTKIILKDSTGKEILSFAPEKQFSSVVLSSADVKQGETYTVTVGDSSQTIEMASIIYGSGGGFGGHGGGIPGGNMQPPNGEMPQGNFDGQKPTRQ